MATANHLSFDRLTDLMPPRRRLADDLPSRGVMLLARLALRLTDLCLPWTRPRDPQLRAVRRLDACQRVFGAQEHRYRAHRVRARELAEFEAWAGLRLPEGYRRHLVEVGTGAGPYYGLWSLQLIRDELEHLQLDWQEDGQPGPCPTQPFPFTREDARQVQARLAASRRNSAEDLRASRPYAINGYIPICHLGCEHRCALVVTGPDAGCVWLFSQYDYNDTRWMPAERPSGLLTSEVEAPHTLPPLPAPPTFEEWYQGWIDAIHADFNA